MRVSLNRSPQPYSGLNYLPGQVPSSVTDAWKVVVTAADRPWPGTDRHAVDRASDATAAAAAHHGWAPYSGIGLQSHIGIFLQVSVCLSVRQMSIAFLPAARDGGGANSELFGVRDLMSTLGVQYVATCSCVGE